MARAPGGLLQLLQPIPPAGVATEPEIEDDEVWVKLGDIDGVNGCLRGKDTIPLCFEHLAQQVVDVGIVFDDENAGLHSGPDRRADSATRDVDELPGQVAKSGAMSECVA